MTDQEIEQERQRIEPPLEPLYVDSKADERSREVFLELVRIGVFGEVSKDEAEAMLDEGPYVGDGSIVRPFMTLEQAREAQQPGQNIIIAGYATIGRAFGAMPNIPPEIKERTE